MKRDVALKVLPEIFALDGDRLARFTRDPAALRRYLVDAGLLERTRSGSEYALAAGDGA